MKAVIVLLGLLAGSWMFQLTMFDELPPTYARPMAYYRAAVDRFYRNDVYGRHYDVSRIIACLSQPEPPGCEVMLRWIH
jgi:hypothetical protein